MKKVKYKVKDVQFVLIDEVSLDDFKLFIESLTTEKETWSLDMEIYDKEMCEGKDNIETWYNVQSRYNQKTATIKRNGYTEKIIQQTIFAKHDGKVIGFVSSKSINYPTKYVEISYIVKKEHQRRGIGTQLLSLIENYISERDFDIIAMGANYFEDNIASDRAFSKAGWDRVNKIGNKVVVQKNTEKGN